MENSVKKLILRKGFKSQVLLTKKREMTFQFSTDDVEATVVGKLIGEVVYFRVVGEDVLYALKGDRFYTVEDTSIWGDTFTPPKGATGTPKEEVESVLEVTPTKENGKEAVVLDSRPIAPISNNRQPVDDRLTIVQLDYHGKPEELPKSMYKNMITCSCGQPRWVKNSDIFQVRFCKPCTMVNRKQMSKERRCMK